MSWWRKEKVDTNTGPTIPVITIPEDFYAGRTPDISFEHSTKKRTLKNNLTSVEKKALDRTTQVGGGATNHPVELLSSRKTFIWILATVFGLGIAGASLYYFVFAKKQAPVTTPTPITTTPEPVNPEPVVETSVVETPVEATSTPNQPATESLSIVSITTADAPDADSDSLTDLEEDLFKTDPNLPDSDQDKYTDAHEVYNLYNPAGKEPMKLGDSGLVLPFTNPTYGYQVYAPVSWAVGNVDPEYKTTLFSTFTGEYVRTQVFEKTENETLGEFLARVLPDEKVNNYIPFQSRFNEAGFQRTDFMVFIWFKGNTAIVMTYNLPPQSNAANYRTVIKMMARSFSFGESALQIPKQAVESPTTTPEEPAVETTTSSPQI